MHQNRASNPWSKHPAEYADVFGHGFDAGLEAAQLLNFAEIDARTTIATTQIGTVLRLDSAQVQPM